MKMLNAGEVWDLLEPTLRRDMEADGMTDPDEQERHLDVIFEHFEAACKLFFAGGEFAVSALLAWCAADISRTWHKV